MIKNVMFASVVVVAVPALAQNLKPMDVKGVDRAMLHDIILKK